MYKYSIYDINVMNPNTKALDIPTFVGCPLHGFHGVKPQRYADEAFDAKSHK